MAVHDDNPQSSSGDRPLLDVNQSQADFDVDFFRQVLERNGENTDVLRRQAELLSRRGDYETALTLDRRLARLAPTCCVAHYNMACSLAMTGLLEEAITSLRRALQLGYRDFANLEADSDLDALRDHSGYEALLREYGWAD
jgi:tetratricopeptide (TPR) repeat protein